MTVHVRRPAASKADVLARYEEHSHAAEEHRKMMSSAQTWENRFEEAAHLIPWKGVRTWLDVGCGTARLFQKVIDAGVAPALERCVGVDATVNSLQTARDKAWPQRPAVTFSQHDIEDLDSLDGGTFDLVTMVGVVYQCGLPPALAVEKCLRRVASPGLFLVTTENPRFRGFVEDPHGCYPERSEFEAMLRSTTAAGPALVVQYTNPLWRQRAAGVIEEESADYKEIFFLAACGAPITG